MKHLHLYSLVILFVGNLLFLNAKAPIGVQKKLNQGFRTSQSCLPPSASAQLDVNNVRALLHNGGDMWWDLVSNPRYEVPKGSGKHSLFASSLWIGGIDEAGQLRLAAQTYRQSGNDFWPGPLTDGAASIDEATCELFDRMWKINKTEIDGFRADFADNGLIDNPEDYPNVFGWPAAGSSFSTNSDGLPVEAFRPDGSVLFMAPFVDIDGNPFDYNPNNGDYPEISGDQAIWWVLNDKGNVHTETGAEPIGIEIHMLAFAFTTASSINDMTFYDQTVINRSSQVLNDTYIGQWVDSDVGKFNDDYVGCDTLRGLGFGFNADADDDGAAGYGLNPPAVGVDFFQGPLADPFDGIDNDKDGIVDEPGETIIMSKFVYYNNDFSLIGNPEVAQHYYGYLTGFWKDGTPIVDNFTNGGVGNGYGPAAPGPPTNYMFPGDACINIGWTEDNADNPKNEDRRFIQSAGPFTLQPGAVNQIITGVVWARGFFNDQFGSVCELLQADDVAQALFDNDFTLLDGPDAPDLEIAEYDRGLVLSWGYDEALKEVRNNFNESYAQADPVLKANRVVDSVFRFQGYIIYQLADATVGPNELNDPDRARIVVQCDIEDGVSTIVNRTEQAIEGLDQPVIVDEVMVQGADEGIFHSIKTDKDLFALGGDNKLKNYTTYYYAAIAYAQNDTSSDGRKFVPGNRFYRIVSAVPHKPELENRGTVLQAQYGDGIEVTQISGIGNGGNFVRISKETEQQILQNSFSSEIVYQAGASPIEVKIVDAKLVKPFYYQLQLTKDRFVEEIVVSEDTTTGAKIIDSVFSEWILYESSTEGGSFAPVFAATYTKRNDGSPLRPEPLVGTERVIKDRGFSIAIKDVDFPGDTLDIAGNTGLIGAEIVFNDPLQNWLAGLQDNDGLAAWNWIRSDERIFRSASIYDKHSDYESIIGGRWAPFSLARSFNNDPLGGGVIGPCLPVGLNTSNRRIGVDDLISLSELPDVDIIFSSDISKWSRCIVVETSPNSNLGSGAWPLSAKWRDNVDQQGNSEGTKTRNDHGMGWFPGYAINVNTGERLNIFFGESEWDKANNGDDMIFNPTSNFGQGLDRVGGRHYVYITDTRYDGFESLKDTLQNADELGVNGLSDAIFFNNTGNNLASVYRHVSWVGIPMLTPGFSFGSPDSIPTEARIALRVKQPFRSRPQTNDQVAFQFNTVDYAAASGQLDVAQNALDLILAVPNPYYAYSAYESGQLDNVVKFTNLPQQCKISIFTLNGQLVRQYNKDSDKPDQNWDLKNHSGVPIASGVYITHIDAGELGEKILKLFIAMRQIDLDSF